MALRATSYTRLIAHKHCTLSTLIGGKGGAGPSSLPRTLEGPMEYVNARWVWSLHGFLHGIEWIVFHGHLDCFQKPPLGGRPNTIPGDHGIPNAHDCWFILFYHVRGPAWIEVHWNNIRLRVRSHMASHWTSGSMIPRFWRCLGMAFGHFLLGFHNLIAKVIGMCVKWP